MAFLFLVRLVGIVPNLGILQNMIDTRFLIDEKTISSLLSESQQARQFSNAKSHVKLRQDAEIDSDINSQQSNTGILPELYQGLYWDERRLARCAVHDLQQVEAELN